MRYISGSHDAQISEISEVKPRGAPTKSVTCRICLFRDNEASGVVREAI
jgi:hypothetical protein